MPLPHKMINLTNIPYANFAMSSAYQQLHCPASFYTNYQ